MTPQQLATFMDLLIASEKEDGRDPINFYLGRNQFLLFEKLVGVHPEATGQPKTWRMIPVHLYNFSAAGVMVSSVPV